MKQGSKKFKSGGLQLGGLGEVLTTPLRKKCMLRITHERCTDLQTLNYVREQYTHSKTIHTNMLL
jgi:hypothetical protein